MINKSLFITEHGIYEVPDYIEKRALRLIPKCLPIHQIVKEASNSEHLKRWAAEMDSRQINGAISK